MSSTIYVLSERLANGSRLDSFYWTYEDAKKAWGRMPKVYQMDIIAVDEGPSGK